MIKRFFICFIVVSLCFALAACNMNEGSDSSDMGGGLANPNGDPSINVTDIAFAVDAGSLTLRPNKTYDPRDFLDTVPSGGVLPSGITFSVARDTMGPPTSICAYVNGNELSTYSADDVSYTLTATYNGANKTCKFYIKAPDSSHGQSDVASSAVSGKVYATQDKVGTGGQGAWYAIYFINENQVGIGMCSVRRENAIKLAKGVNTGTGSSKILNYTYSSGVYDLQGFVRAVGGECVIQNGVLKNYFFANPTEFKLVN